MTVASPEPAPLEPATPNETPPAFADASFPSVHRTETEELAEEKALRSWSASYTIFDAVAEGDRDRVRSFLEQGANVNEVSRFLDPRYAPKSNQAVNRMEFHGTPIAVAVLRCDMQMVEMLVSHGGSLEMPYSFKAGKRQCLYEPTPIFATVINGNLEHVKALVRLNANVGHVAKMAGVPNNTLLWQASYAGDPFILKYILELRAQPQLEQRAVFQDDENLVYTPLHIAARMGHTRAAELLIACKADIHVSTNLPKHQAGRMSTRSVQLRESTPLTDAVDNAHASTVRLLVANMADVFAEETMEYIFKVKNNMVTISAVADGLATTQVKNETVRMTYIKDKMTLKHMKMFLNTPGDAAGLIMDAAFQKRLLKQTRRRVYKTTHIRNYGSLYGSINVAIGPDHDTLERSVPADDDVKITRSLHERTFYQALFPDPLKIGGDRPTQVPIDVYQCVVKGVHRDPEVMYAIQDAASDEIFKDYGCQAIISLGWKRVLRRYNCAVVMNLAFAVLLFDVSFDLNQPDSEDSKRSPGWRLARLLLLWFLLVVDALRETMQLVGYILLGKGRDYLSSLLNYVDMVRISLTFVVLVLLSVLKEEQWTDVAARLPFSLICLFRWMKGLYCLYGFEQVGPRMLSIERGIKTMWPFLVVVFFPLVGFVHFYFSTGIWKDDILVSFDIIYRLGFVGDLNLEQMQNVEADHPNLPWRFWSRVFMVAVNLFLGLTMMNIFIAVVYESYSEAYQRRDLLFWRNRARITFDEIAIETVEAALCCVIFQSSRRRIRPAVSEVALDERWGCYDYVWFCKPTKATLEVADGAIADYNDQLQTSTMARRDQEEMYRMVQQMANQFDRIGTAIASLNNRLNDMSSGLDGSVTLSPAFRDRNRSTESFDSAAG